MPSKGQPTILQKYLDWRDFSGSAKDSYAQDLMTFYNHAVLHDEEGAFLSLLHRADAQGKYIMHVSPFTGEVFYDDYFIKDLVITGEMP